MPNIMKGLVNGRRNVVLYYEMDLIEWGRISLPLPETMKEGCVAVLFCGGKSRRMGFDKAFLQWQGSLLLERQITQLQHLFNSVVLSCERREKLEHLAISPAVHIAEDRYPNTGPLGAICTAFLQTTHPFLFVTACDMPHFDEALLLQLWQNTDDADVVLCTHEGKDEPLFAFYHRRCLPLFQKQLQEKNHRLRGMFSHLRVKKISIDKKRAEHVFANLNTQDDVRRLGHFNHMGFVQETNEMETTLDKPIQDEHLLFVPNLVQVGAFSRNDGKTTLVCKAIENLCKFAPVFAVKVICVNEERGVCHRGHAGCGLCSSLKDNFDWQKESGKHPTKDTALMKAAGAKEAFLLRSRKECLAEALSLFMQKEIPEGAVLVCESNRLRFFVKPGVFLFATKSLPPSGDIKPGTMDLCQKADRIVLRGEELLGLTVERNKDLQLQVALTL